MKLNMNEIPRKAMAASSPQVGDVYPCKGGPRGEGKFWVIASIVNNMAYALAVNIEGEIVGCTGYGLHAFAGRDLLGRVEALESLRLDIDWIES